jgi:hypothetical protein
MEGLQNRLLEELYTRYNSRSGTALNSFIKKVKPKKQSALEFAKDIKTEIEYLTKRELVTWVADAMKGKRADYPESEKYKKLLASDVHYTFDEIYVEVKLSEKGLDYARSIVNTQMSISINKWIKIFTGGLLFLALLSAIVQMRQCTVSVQQYKQSLESRTPYQLYLKSVFPSILSLPWVVNNKDSLNKK